MTTYQHIDFDWQSAFILESRTLDYSGAAIGAALAEVEAHCADSGETALDAFGDAREYATSLKLPRTIEPLGTVIAGGLLGFVGLMLVPAAVHGLVRDGVAVFTAGQLISAGIVVVLIAMAGIWGRWAYRHLDRLKPWHGALIGVAVPAIWVGLMLIAPTPYAFPAIAVCVIGVIALIVGTILNWIGIAPNPLTDPLTPHSSRGRYARAASIAIWPVAVTIFSILKVLT